MTVKKVLESHSKYSPMVVWDLTGRERQHVIQVDLLVLVPKIEAALRAAYAQCFSDTCAIGQELDTDRGVTAGIEVMGEEI